MTADKSRIVPGPPVWPPKFLMFRIQMRWQFGKRIIDNREAINSRRMRFAFEWTGWRWIMRTWTEGKGGEYVTSTGPVVQVEEVEEILLEETD